MKYFLKGSWQDEYIEVTKEQYVDAEEKAGFRSDDPGEIATAAFDGNGVSGITKPEDWDLDIEY